MSLSKLTTNLNNVQSLPDKPSITASELKAVFDAAGNAIKTYLNATLTAEVDSLISQIQSSLTDDESAITALNTLTNTMKTKLDGIEDNANNYVHPTTSGNKHIPSGGATGQILKWSSDGVAVWETEKDTTYSPATSSADGLMSKGDKSKLDGIEAQANKYVHPTGAGNNHIPSGGSSGQILKWSSSGVAVWAAEKDTTYSDATTSAHGLMTAADKTKLNGIATGATKNVITVGTAAPTGGSNGDIYIQYFT